MNNSDEIQFELQNFSNKELEDEIKLSICLLSELVAKILIDELSERIRVFSKELKRRKILKLNNY